MWRGRYMKMVAEMWVMQPQATRGWKRPGQVLPETLWREQGPADIAIWDFWPLRTVRESGYVILSHDCCSRYRKLILLQSLCIKSITENNHSHNKHNKKTKDPRRDKQNVVYPHSRTLFSLKKEGNSNTCCNTDEP